MGAVVFDTKLHKVLVHDHGNSGGVEFATQTEVNAGTVSNKAVAPDTLATAFYKKGETDTAIATAIASAIGAVNTALDELNGEQV